MKGNQLHKDLETEVDYPNHTFCADPSALIEEIEDAKAQVLASYKSDVEKVSTSDSLQEVCPTHIYIPTCNVLKLRRRGVELRA